MQQMLGSVSFFFQCYGDHRALHCVRHSFPTRRSSDLRRTRGMAHHLESHDAARQGRDRHQRDPRRSEEHTSELQSPDTISYAVFCLKKKKKKKNKIIPILLCEKKKKYIN